MEIDPETFAALVASVKRNEEMLEALEELINDNHQETLEKLSDLADGGLGFSTFES